MRNMLLGVFFSGLPPFLVGGKPFFVIYIVIYIYIYVEMYFSTAFLVLECISL